MPKILNLTIYNNNTSKNIIQVSVPVILCKRNDVIITGLDTFIETSKLKIIFNNNIM